LIVGVGNPGAEYEKTRHNVGFMAVDLVRDRYAPDAIPRSRFHGAVIETRLPGEGGADEPAMLLKPLTFMNRSGQSIAEAVRYYKLDPAEDLLVIVDEVQLPVGTIRIRAGGSSGGHNGLANIEQLLGTADYARMRIGIDRPGEHITQRDYVLGRFTDEQKDAVAESLDKAARAAVLWASKGVTAAMNAFNTKPPKPPRKDREAPDAETDRGAHDESEKAARQPEGGAADNHGKAEQP